MADSPKDILELRRLVNQIHIRARNNAFAHREAANEAERRNDSWSKWNIGATCITGIFTTIALIAGKYNWNGADIVLTIMSVISTGIALFTQSVLLSKKYDAKEASHHHFQGSFQHISQRAREVERLEDIGRIHALVDDLERDFALLKARAPEPEDKHFDVAALIQDKRNKDRRYSGALSFEDLKTSSTEPAEASNLTLGHADSNA